MVKTYLSPEVGTVCVHVSTHFGAACGRAHSTATTRLVRPDAAMTDVVCPQYAATSDQWRRQGTLLKLQRQIHLVISTGDLRGNLPGLTKGVRVARGVGIGEVRVLVNTVGPRAACVKLEGSSG